MKATAFLLVLSMALLSTAALADVPGMINYQGTLTDENGVAADTTVSMTFAIYADSSGGSPVPIWWETQSAVQCSNGIFNVLLGRVNAIDDTVFCDVSRWLQVQVGSDAPMGFRQRIASVGYAFKAAEADTADYARNAPTVSDGDWTIIGNHMYSAVPGSVGIGKTSPSAKLEVWVDRGAAVRGTSEGGPGAKYGGWFDALEGGSRNIGVFARGGCKGLPPDPGSEANIGIWAYDASSGTVPIMPSGNWAGYFGGDCYISDSLGIGTTSPAERLHVVGDIRLNAGGDIAFADDSTRIHESSDDLYLEADDDIYISPDDDIRMAGSTIFVDGSANRVGIGTETPDYEFDVNGDIGLNEYIYHNGDANTYVRYTSDQIDLYSGGIWMISAEETTQDEVAINDGSADVDFRVESDNSTSALFVRGSDGNVGIGTTSPTEKLEVNGNAKTSGDLDVAGNATIDNTLYISENSVNTSNPITTEHSTNSTSWQYLTYYHLPDQNTDRLMTLYVRISAKGQSAGETACLCVRGFNYGTGRTTDLIDYNTNAPILGILHIRSSSYANYYLTVGPFAVKDNQEWRFVVNYRTRNSSYPCYVNDVYFEARDMKINF